jgi:hypothetical protein
MQIAEAVYVQTSTRQNSGDRGLCVYIIEIRWVDPDTGAQIDPPAAVMDLGTATSRTLTFEDIPDETAPDRVVEIDVMVRARRSVGGTWIYARAHRTMRFAAPFAAGWGAAWGFNWGG